MTFHGKPSGGPDAVGGLFPRSEIQPFRSRAGAALVRGAVVALDLSGSATEVDVTDSNAGLPGAGDASDDTIWNTVVDPVAGHINGTIATLVGVVLPAAGIADNAIGKVQLHGIVDNARCLCSGVISNLEYGVPLSFTATNSFNATVAATDRVVAFYCGVDQTATNVAVTGRVMLHNGVGYASGEIGGTVA